MKLTSSFDGVVILSGNKFFCLVATFGATGVVFPRLGVIFSFLISARLLRNLGVGSLGTVPGRFRVDVAFFSYLASKRSLCSSKSEILAGFVTTVK